MKIEKKLILPLIISGVFLGIYPIAQTHVSPQLATWSGMYLLGNHFGYTLVALIFAYLNNKNWKSNFLTAFFLITVANLTYYIMIEVFYLINIFPWRYGLAQQWRSILLWTVLGAILSALIATSVHFIRNGKLLWLKRSASLVTYLSLLWVIYEYYVTFIIRTYFNHYGFDDLPYRYIHDNFIGRVFAGDVFWSVLGFLICTTLLAIVWKKELRTK